MPDLEFQDLLVEEMRELRKEIKELREAFHAFQLDVVSTQSESRGSSRMAAAVISAGVSALIAIASAFIHNLK